MWERITKENEIILAIEASLLIANLARTINEEVSLFKYGKNEMVHSSPHVGLIRLFPFIKKMATEDYSPAIVW